MLTFDDGGPDYVVTGPEVSLPMGMAEVYFLALWPAACPTPRPRPATKVAKRSPGTSGVLDVHLPVLGMLAEGTEGRQDRQRSGADGEALPNHGGGVACASSDQ